MPSSTTSPAPSGSAAVYSGSAATSLDEYSSGCSTAGPAVSVPSPLTTASPALTALIAACTSLPSRGPATRALTVELEPAVCGDVVGELDVLDVEFVGDQVGEGREPLRIVDGHSQFR